MFVRLWQVPDEGNSLEAALERFCAEETLDGDNMYKCQRCQQLVRAYRSTRIDVAPNVLQICLKRYRHMVGPGNMLEGMVALYFCECGMPCKGGPANNSYCHHYFCALAWSIIQLGTRCTRYLKPLQNVYERVLDSGNPVLAPESLIVFSACCLVLSRKSFCLKLIPFPVGCLLS
jgi:hypothetical protein